MLAANVWHWWIGIALVLLAILALVALVAAYLKAVTAKQHPGRKQRSAHHTDL
jgi:membrane protein implicated in regulation of membrane protease activity